MSEKKQAMELAIKIKGEIVSSNFEEYSVGLRNSIKSINQNLQTDDDFIQAKLDVKNLKIAEDAVKKAKEMALAEAKNIQDLFASLDAISEDARIARLDLDKTIKKKESEVKETIVKEAIASVDRDIKDVFSARITASIKGKRTIETIREFSSNEVKIINSELFNSRSVINRYIDTHGSWIAPDAKDLELECAKDLESKLAVRVAEKMARDAEQKLKEVTEEKKIVNEVSTPLSSTEKNSTEPAETVAVTASDNSELDKVELNAFLDAIVPIFRQFKNQRETLENPANIKLAGDMATSLNEHYIAMRGVAK